MKSIFTQTILVVAALCAAVVNTKAAVFTNLYSFETANLDSSGDFRTNHSGANPYAGLVLSSNTLYGTTFVGGPGGNGTIFKINTDGTSFTNLHNFSTPMFGTNADGAESSANLLLLSNILYGTTYGGGSGGNGTIFKVNTDGTGFTNLYSFSARISSTNSDGASISSGLVLASNTFYGTALLGGSTGNGTVFKINIDGTSFTNLHNFTALSNSTNTDGANPDAKLVLSGSTLYGTAVFGGNFGNGTVFKVNTDGTGFTNLYSFSTLSTNFALASVTNSDGANPQTDLTLSGSILYGATQHGGNGNEGTMFKINIDGTHFTNFYNFTAINGNTNSDGANPVADLVLSGNTLFGVTPLGGDGGDGTIFQINTNGTGFTNLYNFSALTSGTNSDGAFSTAFLVVSGNVLYGTASGGGIAGWGTVFALNFPMPNLNIQLISSAAVLNWSNPIFLLQAAPTVTGVYTNVPSATSPYTNAITSLQKFFRLQAN